MLINLRNKQGSDVKVAQETAKIEKAKRSAPLIGMAGILALALPSSGLAVVSLTGNASAIEDAAISLFTPGSVDPELAAKFADVSDKHGSRFTPAGAGPVEQDRFVTVAVRVDEQTAKAISVRSASVSAIACSRCSGERQNPRYTRSRNERWLSSAAGSPFGGLTSPVRSKS